MNIQEYISSGVVESYVLGIADEAEQREYEQMLSRYPELGAAQAAFEQSLEAAALANAIQPAPELRDSILASVLDPLPRSTQPAPVRIMSGGANWWKFAAAASFLLLAVSALYNYNQFRQKQEMQKDLANLQTQYQASNDQLAALQADKKVLQQNSNMKMATMKGIGGNPSAFATVYWDTASHDVYLLANNLPKPPSDKQYQLWALLDGKPIDMGVVDNAYFVSQKQLLIRAKNVQNAQAFAITLESMGGNPTPKGEMIVLGNL